MHTIFYRELNVDENDTPATAPYFQQKWNVWANNSQFNQIKML